MTQLLNRHVELSFVPANGGTEVLVKNLQVEFSVERTLEREPSTATFSIYNLQDITAAAIRNPEGMVATLRASYGDGELQTIFVGDVNHVTQRIDGANRLLEVECGDGKRSSRHWARKWFRKGTKLEDVFAYLAKTANLKLNKAALRKTLDAARKQNQRRGYYSIGADLKNGMHVRGYAVDELHELCLSHQLEFSIQNNELRITQDDLEVGEAPALTPTTGLIGSPVVAYDSKGRGILSAQCVLIPNLFPGSIVAVSSEYVTGDFRVHTASYSGSVFGSEPLTIDIEANKVS